MIVTRLEQLLRVDVCFSQHIPLLFFLTHIISHSSYLCVFYSGIKIIYRLFLDISNMTRKEKHA